MIGKQERDSWSRLSNLMSLTLDDSPVFRALTAFAD